MKTKSTHSQWRCYLRHIRPNLMFVVKIESLTSSQKQSVDADHRNRLWIGWESGQDTRLKAECWRWPSGSEVGWVFNLLSTSVCDLRCSESFLSSFLDTQLLQNIRSPLKQTWRRTQIGAYSQLLSVTQLSLFLHCSSRPVCSKTHSFYRVCWVLCNWPFLLSIAVFPANRFWGHILYLKVLFYCFIWVLNG